MNFDQAQYTIAFIVLFSTMVPIISSLWKVFSIRESLSNDILACRHRIELLEHESNSAREIQASFLRGIQERLQHVRDRSSNSEEKLARRLEDLESYVEKTTAFEKRRT